jgi:thiol:disulfide interchange protein DsbA
MRFIRHILAALALLCAAQAHAEVVAGRDYKLLNPPQPTAGKKIEVLEFFFYGCSHCYHLHPLLDAWDKKKPGDVELQYVPVIFHESAEPMARAFYALEAMGRRGQLHDALFKALNVQGIDLRDEASITGFVAQRGVDGAKFGAAYNSFSMSSRIARANQMVQSYGVRGTPTIAVDGKYIISNLLPEDTIRVLDEVIKIARKERSKR